MSIKSLSARRPLLGLTPSFSDFFEPWSDWFQNGFAERAMTVPGVNISEDKNCYQLDLAAPGLHKKDFNIDIEGDVLTISGKKESDREEKDESYTRKEYNYSSFSRSFTLPKGVRHENIEATYDGGVLRIVLQKNEQAKLTDKKSVEIK